MKHEVVAQWMGKMQFNALVNGHTIVMDAPERVGGEDQGSIPKPLVLTALSGCTGMDVVVLLRKKNITLQNIDIRVEGTISKQVPIVYTDIHLIYDMQGDELYKQAALDAVQDSQLKLCGVSNMLKKAVNVTWEVNYNGVCKYSNQAVSEVSLN